MSIYAQNLLRELVALGHEVTMISQYRGDAIGTAIYGGGPPPPVPGVRVIGLEQLGEQDGGDFERDVDVLVRTIAHEHDAAPFDLLHAQYGYPTGWAALLAGRALGLPVIVSIQGGDGHWVGSCCETHRLAMVRVLEHADALLIGGRSFALEVHERLGTPLDRFTIVPGAVDTNRFTPAGEPAAGQSARSLYHGRVDRRKGVLDFLDALAGMLGQRWTANVSGIGPDLAAAQERAATLGLGSRVSFSGYADYATVPDIYRAHDLFVSPTYAEGFSNTILEAMASGLPVVAGRSVGVVDCLRDNQNGLLIEPVDVPALVDALTRVMGDAALRARLAAAALEECRRTYSWTAVGRQIGEIYRSLAGSTRWHDFPVDLPLEPCRFRAEPHLL